MMTTTPSWAAAAAKKNGASPSQMFGIKSQPGYLTVTDAFLQYATKRPFAIAARDLSNPDRPLQITYGELWQRSTRLARKLRELGVVPGSMVPLVVKRGIDMLVGIMAILTCGAQYVPLDGGVVPDSTLRFVTEQAGGRSCTVLAIKSTQHRLDACDVANVVCIDATWDQQEEDKFSQMSPFESLAVPDGGCYVIYTSGTTGTPKGVDVSHRNVCNLVCLAPGNLGITEGTRVGQVLNISFDMAAWEILGSLCNGGTLILRGSDWRAALKKIDVLISTPSILAKYDPKDFPNIRTVATAGEASSQRLADKWASSSTYYNCCGPTETTIVNTMHRHWAGEPLTIGLPTPNNNVYILNEALEPVADGEAGLMWAGGWGVSRGYVQLDDKTAENYRPDPFANDGSMMYNTGDLGKRTATGSIDILGRQDDQVKLKGFRVELDGVTASLNSCSVIDRAAVLFADNKLHAFITPDNCDMGEVKRHMQYCQPYYAVPSQFHLLDSMPLTANGKIDKRVLRSLTEVDDLPEVSKPAKQTPEKIRPVEQSKTTASPQTTVEIVETAAQPAAPVISEKGIETVQVAPTPKEIGLSRDSQKMKDTVAVVEKSEETIEITRVEDDNAKAVVAVEDFVNEKRPEDSSQGLEIIQKPKQAIVTMRQPSDISDVSSSGVRPHSDLSDSSDWSISDEKTNIDLEAAVPDKHMGKRARGLRYRMLIVYRRLFSFVGICNIAAAIAIALTGLKREWLGTVTAMNLVVGILIRQEFVINALYTITCSVPKSWPLGIRKRCAKIFHLGGVHSGAGVSAALWLLANNIGDAVCMATGKCSGSWGHQSIAAKAVSWLLTVFFVAMLAMAYPTVRKKYHDYFERTHRFLGWTMLGVFWVQVVLTANDGRGDLSLGQACLRSPPLWLLVVATLSVASSWFWLRKVAVEAEVLSDHAVRLHFDYTVPVNGSFTRLSRRPLVEWHSFATIPAAMSENGRPTGYSLVVSNAGDWTKKTIQDAPTYLWVRGVPTCGVMRIATLFRSIVVIATGSGIGPLLGHIQAPSCPTQLIWSTRTPEKTFGEAMVNTIKKKIPGAVFHDTKALGRPDLVKMGYNMVKSCGAEAVVIIANEKITKKVVYGLETRGIPAYGAIWDS